MKKLLILVWILLPSIVWAQSRTTPGMLMPTPNYYDVMPEPDPSWSGIDVPEHLWTVENGIRVPHPVTKDGRVLAASALTHHVFWTGLTWRGGDIYNALSDYILLAALKQNPGLLDEMLFTYAVRFLPMAARGQIPCGSNAIEPTAPCGLTYAQIWLIGDRNLDYVVGSQAHKERVKQAILSKREHLMAAAPSLPLRFVDVSYFQFKDYDDVKGGLTLNWGMPGSHQFYANSQKQVWFHYITSTAGNGSGDESIGPLIAKKPPSRSITMMDMIPTNKRFDAVCCGTQYQNIGTFLESFWALGPGEAQSLIDKFDGAVPVEYSIDLVEATVDSRQTYWRWTSRLQSVSAYRDQALKQKIHQFPCDVIPGCISANQR